MQIEVQMYLHIIVVVGVILSTPYIFRVFALLGKYIGMKLYPTTTVELEYKGADGLLQTKIVKLDDDDELVQALIKLKEKQ
ncbi:hypothetical protein [Vibrio sp. TBV020]|uniref:hypothetical protein n=1 Tax=Vibrio sp. TBV020 TaxID=3137398 RepID=UPI0038CD28C6